MDYFRVPTATYRIQFSLNFRFVDGRDLVPYLNDLGISDLYSSPRFRARRGSPHAYDVANPLQINSELGTEEEFADMSRKLTSYGMGLLLDVVPNHMAASKENPWWMDVLENGQSSLYAAHFDIDWRRSARKAGFENKVVLPVLGDLYGNVLENGELVLKLDENGFFVQYYEHRFPINPKSYGTILRVCHEKIETPEAQKEVEEVLRAVARLEERTAKGEAAGRRHHEKEDIKRRIWKLYLSGPEVRACFDESMRLFGGVKGDPASFDLMDELLAAQAYRLAFWRMAGEELNYRRFFDITDLIGVRVEDPEVFDARHPEILKLVHSRSATGFRVDHIDGLYDPLGYLRMLQQRAVPEGNPETCSNFYVVVEKILGTGERLPKEWATCGTTGYDFLNELNGIFISRAGLRKLHGFYRSFTGIEEPVPEIRYQRKKQVMQELFAAEVRALRDHIGRLAAQDRKARDVSLSEITLALVEVVAHFPVYRTYIRGFEVTPRDRGYIEQTIAKVQEQLSGRIDPEALRFLKRVLLAEPPHYIADKEDWLNFVMRWQQFTGPVMAKGYEDTTCYVYNRLLSQDEVGSDPESQDEPLDVRGFHERNARRLADWPYTLNATSTHDTKRSEDVRARLNVLSEVPEEWERHVRCWSEANRARKTEVDGIRVPDSNEELHLYQALLGAWPLCDEDKPAFADRIRNYMQKALREAKTHTSWLHPNEAYENGVLEFISRILEESDENEFMRSFTRFQKVMACAGAVNGLSQVLLKITSPGVPDFYQGTELWDFSLVDPDNRRAVDFTKRAAMLDAVRRSEAEDRPALIGDLVANWQDGRIKLFATYKSLTFRRDNRDLFLRGEYIPLGAEGPNAGRVCAFARRHENRWAVIAVPLFVAGAAENPADLPFRKLWGDETLILPPGAAEKWRNVFTAEPLASIQSGERPTLRLSEVFGSFPVALLESEAAD